ncbi:DUF1801 domain-containing protein [Hyalangium rubrum]|uniref:DUF1801 domain-containing protein n=1 Tax=Hyalangium rubrum TaxID=3103134 RepID=A0ABU5HH21_9BACT|nr:DUF1801 domain-containing protein [Hyalangium sp. s54d21]MDY7232138.1 DUF1801 domain-containing protein [Hyalangium sp. s54d21]
MAELKTKKTVASVEDFLASVSPEKKRQDAIALCELMRKVTKLEPKMWGPSMVGFGDYHYQYESGHEGDTFLVGFSPRKANLTLYIMPGFEPYTDLLSQLGKYKTGKSCLYINTLDDVDAPTLRKIIQSAFADMKKRKKD